MVVQGFVATGDIVAGIVWLTWSEASRLLSQSPTAQPSKLLMTVESGRLYAVVVYGGPKLC